MGKRWSIAAVVLSALVTALLLSSFLTGELEFEPREVWLSEWVRPTEFQLNYYSTTKQGRVWGASGKRLYRISESGTSALLVKRFAEPINGLHHMPGGALVVATDADTWSADLPCRIYLSDDGGQTFREILEIRGGTALGWSLASDKAGNLFVGEYGPLSAGVANRLWRSGDLGHSWEVIFEAPERDGVHIHRVAVDPYTQDLWVTHGDSHDGVYRSRDAGRTWEYLRDEQSTAVAFTPTQIFWGEDRAKGLVTRFDRLTNRFYPSFEARQHGYGGSVYAMASAGERVLVAFMKYPDQQHAASLWQLREGAWLKLASFGDMRGSPSIGGPDGEGRFYINGYVVHP